MSRRLKIIAFAATLAGFAAMVGAYDLGFERWPPRTTLADGRSVPLYAAGVQACFKARALALLDDATADDNWQACRQRLMAYGALDAFKLRCVAVAGSAAIGLVALFSFALSLRIDSSLVEGHSRGTAPRGRSRPEGLRRACAAECRIHGEGVALVPSIPMGREREARHFLILGSVGGGKTQTMLHLIDEAIARKDGVLVLDTKGDMMGGLPAQGDPLLVAPHDRRSLVWDVAADCSIKQDARELAARFIPPSSDPMWSQAAQEIFVACIVHLQATRGSDWGWADLETVVTADIDTAHDLCKGSQPECAAAAQPARQQDDPEHSDDLPDPHADRLGPGRGLA